VSARFGSPKALARLDGETLAERAWRVLGEACDKRIAVGKHADELELPFPVLDDGTEVRAALAGIVTGVRAATTELCVVVPVDMPRLMLMPDLLLELAEACVLAAAPKGSPLPAAYRKAALPVLEECSPMADSRSTRRSPSSRPSASKPMLRSSRT
jgi:molybdopterin-guanine dinucleotide biosynthesis protein A